MSETEKVKEIEKVLPDPPKENPLITRAKLPGEIFALPSGGIFYENDELDGSVINGEVHIFPMAAYDEVIIKTPSLLLNGQAVHEVFTRCIPQIKKPMELLAKDVDFLLIALRQVTYGETMDVTYTHDCENAKEHNYQVKISDFTKNAKKINPTTVGKNYSLTLKDKGISQKVIIKPAKYKDIIDMLQLFTLDTSAEEGSDELLELAKKETKGILLSVSSIIKSVDGMSDRNLINEWLEFIQAKWVDQLTDAIEKTSNWGPTFDHKDKCKDCGKIISISVPMNPISFFT